MSADENPQPAATTANLTVAEERFALLVAEDELTDVEIAEEVGITRPTVWRWKKKPHLAARIREIMDEIGAIAHRRAIGHKARRVRTLNDRWIRLQSIIEQRAADPKMKGVAGGDTGLLVHQAKGIGKGENFEVVHEYILDAALLKELREHEKQAAIELGQWVEKLAPTNPDGTDEYNAGGFSDDEVAGILTSIAARLGLAPAGEDREKPENAPRQLPPPP